MAGLKKSRHLSLPFKDIEVATKNFNETCIIGKGGYGKVYKSELSIDGKLTIVAVKRLDPKFGQGSKEFLTEIELLTGQQHPNLISLLGYCEEENENIIVYEYADRGSLEQYIRYSDATYKLTWLKRLKICIDAAHGLDYLHSHVGKHQCIIHRDIKSANILLDENWVAKISDLGLSKLSLAGLDRNAVISHACGTHGYCEPEYIISGIVTNKSDVYSFGMVLFEVLCGRLCNLKNPDGLTAKLVKEYYKNKKLDKTIDPSLRIQMSSNSKSKFSAIAYGCLHDDREQRPSMDVVKKVLEETLKIQVSGDFITEVSPMDSQTVAVQSMAAPAIQVYHGLLSGGHAAADGTNQPNQEFLAQESKMQTAATVASPAVAPLMDLIKNELGYWLFSTKYIEDMFDRVRQLNDTAADMRRRKEANDVKNLVVPHHVETWLKDVEDINREVARIDTDETRIECFNIKVRYEAGKKSNAVVEKIKRLEERSKIEWTDQLIVLAKVASKKGVASTSRPLDNGTQNSFKSRDIIFKQAFKFLELNNSKTEMMALCGMGGVGKTYMMDQLKKHVEDTHMFKYVVKVVAGENTGIIALQHAIAEKTGGALTETTTDGRAERLEKKFVAMSEDCKKKILVILDDVWKKVDLRDIGLARPLPYGLKLLFTSRDANVCFQMGVEPDLVFSIGPLNDDEAKVLFFKTVGLSKDDDPHLYKIGEQITKRCGNLPIALITIGPTLKGNIKDESEWKQALYHLQHHNLKDHYGIVHNAFKRSYDCLKMKYEKEIFLLSGLFPDDFDIPVEELMRYAWGLKLFPRTTLAKTRLLVETCVKSLIRANLLAESDCVKCVKMHDLARSFALSDSREVKQASILNHNDILEQLTEDASESYQRILLMCTEASEFPKDFNCPNLDFLKLVGGDEQLKFAEDFYKNLEKVAVLSYEEVQYPLLPRSPEYSTNLRTLCLNGCELIPDCSSIGDLGSLEVLSFAHCRIEKLPSAIGKLKKLKLLDLTGCFDLSIDDGVFRDLDKLQELYMRVTGRKAIRFTDANCVELGVLSLRLSALEVEFFNNKAQPKNMSFKNLERFKISMGCLLKDNKDTYSFENMLKLVTTSSDLMDCRINNLFKKTENLHLQVKDMMRLKDVLMHPPQDSFSKLRVLVVDGCEDLKYLFTGDMASGLRKLEQLTVSKCRVLESLIHGDQSEKDVVIKFQKLKFLTLDDLPNLISLWDIDKAVELPQLVGLYLWKLPNITNIYLDNAMQQFFKKEIVDVSMHPSQHSISSLKFIDVRGCGSLRYLFTVTTVSGLRKLEHLMVWSCPVLESLIHGDESANVRVIKFQELKFLNLNKLPTLISFSDIDKVVELPQLVEVSLESLPNFTSIYPDSAMQPFFTNQVVIPKLETLKIYEMKNLRQIWPSEMTTSSREELHISMVKVVDVTGCDSLVNLFPTNPMPFLRNLEKLEVSRCNSIEVLFNIDLRHVGIIEEVNSSLRSIHVRESSKLTEVWRIKGADNSSLLISGFQNVENIVILYCKRLRDVFTPSNTNFDMRATMDIKEQNFTDKDLILKEALNSLEPNNTMTQMMALSGLGKVGKTDMMEELNKAVKDLEMFDVVVKLVIGQEANPIALQRATVEYIGEALTEIAKEENADGLRRRFMQMSKDGKKKILVILDDVWKVLDLKDVGIPTPLPNGFKLLITSRDESVCSQMGVEKSSIFRLGMVDDTEAKTLFFKTVGLLKDDDPDLYKIGEEIIMRCGNFPSSLETIACVLKGNKDKSKWEEVLSILQHHYLEDIYEILKIVYEMSYKSLKTDYEKAILFLSSFFPKDFDIPMEDLLRYAWGLKLFPRVYTTLAQARHRIKASIDVLVQANLLIKGVKAGCIKMQEHARDFVLCNFTEVKQALIDHNNMPEDADDSYGRILLKCTNKFKFPVDFNFSNLKLLKITGEKELLKIPHEFYDKMKNLEVVAYERMDNPWLLPYSTNLRTLCLDSCSVIDNFSFLGNLINLEILSFAHCGIQTLPSTIGKLRKLKLLDLTGCVDLSIEDGVFQKLVNLEELSMRCNGSKALHFSDAGSKELEILLSQLCALEVEFSENKLHPKDGSFEKLERFKISLGCPLDDDDNHIDSFKNTLKLVTNSSDILECKIHELFDKTERVYLEVKDMNYLEDVLKQHSFCNLRELEVSDCADLTFLFTIHVASGLMKLEYLRVSKCHDLKSLIHDETGAGSVIMFPKLKLLSLEDLPSLMSLCNTDNRVELQQLVKLSLGGLPNVTTIFPDNEMQPYAFFNKQIWIPNLEVLKISSMEKMKQIWPSETATTCSIEKEVNNISMLREVGVQGCDSLLNLFPCNPLPLLNHLEYLYVSTCGSIQVLFNIDLTSADNINKVKSSLRGISLWGLENLREIWRIKGANDSRPLIHCFQSVNQIHLSNCTKFRDIFAPKNINFVMRARVRKEYS